MSGIISRHNCQIWDSSTTSEYLEHERWMCDMQKHGHNMSIFLCRRNSNPYLYRSGNYTLHSLGGILTTFLKDSASPYVWGKKWSLFFLIMKFCFAFPTVYDSSLGCNLFSDVQFLFFPFCDHIFLAFVTTSWMLITWVGLVFL